MVEKHRKALENELFPRESAQKTLDDVQKVKINRRVKSLAPAALETKKIFEEHKTIDSLFVQLKDIEKGVSEARSTGDFKAEKQMLKKKSSLLQKLIHRKSLSRHLTPSLHKHLKNEKNEVTKTLTASLSLGLGR